MLKRSLLRLPPFSRVVGLYVVNIISGSDISCLFELKAATDRAAMTATSSPQAVPAARLLAAARQPGWQACVIIKAALPTDAAWSSTSWCARKRCRECYSSRTLLQADRLSIISISRAVACRCCLWPFWPSLTRRKTWRGFGGRYGRKAPQGVPLLCDSMLPTSFRSSLPVRADRQ